MALTVAAVAAALRIAYLLAITRTACLDINLDPISDMEAFHRWALTIVSGDWMGRSNFHPWHPWQEAVAPRSQWDAWYGNVFHQEPLYPYLIAFAYIFFPPRPITIIVIQAALGAAGCAFTSLAARRLAGPMAGWGAGLLSAAYGPFLYYESLLLRDAWLIPLHAAMLWTIVEARARAGQARVALWWGAAGGTLGLSFITKASIAPFALAMAVLALLSTPTGAGRRGRAAPVVALAFGFALPLSPVMARNAVVGAPLLQTTTRGPIEFINGNNPWHPGIGWFDGDDERVSRYARDVLSHSGGRLFPAARAVLADWSPHPWRLIMLQVSKLGYFFAPFEMPNNASYSYFRLNNAVLRWAAVSFLWISPLAALGLVVAVARWRIWLPVILFLPLGIATTVAFYVIARFRAPLMPAILMLAGAGLSSVIEWVRRGERARTAAGLALIAVALILNVRSNYPDDDLVRPQDHLIAIAGYKARGETQRALDEARAGRERFPEFPQFWREAGLLEAGMGLRREAAASLREALARNPSDPTVRQMLEDLERAP